MTAGDLLEWVALWGPLPWLGLIVALGIVWWSGRR